MRVVLIIIGSLGALYTFFAIIQLIGTLMTANAGSAYGGASIGASVVPVCFGLIISLICFRGAFRKPDDKKPD